MTLIIGRRYLCGLGFGICTVVYLGPVPGWPRLSRVRNFLVGKTVWVSTASLKPLLVDLNKDKESNEAKE